MGHLGIGVLRPLDRPRAPVSHAVIPRSCDPGPIMLLDRYRECAKLRGGLSATASARESDKAPATRPVSLSSAAGDTLGVLLDQSLVTCPVTWDPAHVSELLSARVDAIRPPRWPRDGGAEAGGRLRDTFPIQSSGSSASPTDQTVCHGAAACRLQSSADPTSGPTSSSS